MTRALFPPSISVLKQICWRGYIDGLKFLQTRSKSSIVFSFIHRKNFHLDMVKSSYLSTQTTISSVLGSDYTEPAKEDEKQLRNGGIAQDVNRMYEQLDDVEEESMDDNESSDEDSSQSDDESIANSSQVTFSPFCEKVTRKKELPTPLFAGKELISFFRIYFTLFSE
jgi:hypothetical protein